MSEDRGKQFVDKSARMVRENLEKGVAAARPRHGASSKAMPPLPKVFATII